MRRDDFALNVQTPAGPADTLALPTVVITYTGPPDELRDRLTTDQGAPLPADAIDVSCRLQAHDDQDRCVVAVTDRLTGAFLLEVNTNPAAIQSLVDAARTANDESAPFQIRIEFSEGEDVEFDKETLLVYDEEGSLQRQHSLIPSGVEL